MIDESYIANPILPTPSPVGKPDALVVIRLQFFPPSKVL